MERFARIRQSSLLITLHTLCPRTGRFRLAVRMISPSPSPKIRRGEQNAAFLIRMTRLRDAVQQPNL